MPDARSIAHVLVGALVALAGGAILGLPHRKRPAGVSTHALVALGAFAYCSIATSASAESDVLRVVQGIAQGVGFVGAAAVLKTRYYIVGITTAASIWIAGAVGSLAVFGDPAKALAVAALAALTSFLLRRLERRYLSRRRAVSAPRGLDEGSAPGAGSGRGLATST